MTPQEELAAINELLAIEEELAKKDAPPTMLDRAKDFGGKALDLAKGVGQSAAAGFGKAASLYPLAMSKAPGIMGMGFNLLGAADLAKGTGDYYSELGKSSALPEPAKPFVEGAAGAFAMPGRAAFQAPVALATASGVGNTAADAAKRFTKDMGETPSNVISLIAGALAGGGTGLLLGPKQSIARQDIRQALEGETPESWGRASQFVDDVAATGARTATLAEGFPGNSQIMDVARAARAADTGGASKLKTLTEGRGDDLTALGKRVAALISGREVEPGEVANTAAAAANRVVTGAKGARSAQYGLDAATGPKLSRRAIDSFEKYMTEQAGIQGTKAETEAYLDIAKIFRNGDAYVQDPTDVKEALKLAKDFPAKYGDPAQNAARRKVYERAYKNAEDFVKDIHGERGFSLAEKNFTTATTDVVDPIMRSPVGQMAGASFDTDKVVPIGRLTGLLDKFQTKTGMEDFLSTLQRSDSGMGPSPLVNDIAKVLVQAKLDKGPPDVGRVLAGNPGSMADERFSTLMNVAGADAPAVDQTIRVARALQDFQTPAGIAGPPNMRLGQALIRPFRTLDMALTMSGERKIAREIGEILSNTTPQGLARLQEIASFNPTVRQFLAANAAFIPGMAQNTTRPEEPQK
jgi:hypothetical protein